VQADLGGPVLWFLFVIMAGSAALAAYVIFDSFRPARAERFENAMARAIWVGPQAVYLVAVAASLFPTVSSQVRLVTLAAMPIAIILQVTYLLKIAHPKPEEDGAGDIDPDSAADATAEPSAHTPAVSTESVEGESTT
jgi:hypothetical protein